jgi:hypothetical protein
MIMLTGFGQNGNNFRLLESDTVSILRQVFGGGNVEILRFASNARTAAKLEKFSVLAYPSSFGQMSKFWTFGDNPNSLEFAAPNATYPLASGNVAAKPRRSQGVC